MGKMEMLIVRIATKRTSDRNDTVTEVQFSTNPSNHLKIIFKNLFLRFSIEWYSEEIGS